MTASTSDHVDLGEVRARLSSAVLSDALDANGLRAQCLATGLNPLEPGTAAVGYAFPVGLQRVEGVPQQPFRGLVAALDAIGPDEVFVTPTARATDIAVWGELLSTAAQRRGAAGALTDGLIRDTAAIRSLGFPVVSAGTIPYDSMGRHEITAHGVSCRIDGVRIDPGDLIFADGDGTVVVPRLLIGEVVVQALTKRSAELDFRRAVAEGMSATDAFTRFGVL